jgi:hypothetical protein
VPGLGPAWSPNSQSLYYADSSAGALKRVDVSGGPPITVRSERTGLFEKTLYYMVERPLVDGRPEFEIRTATPEYGTSRLLARIPASRVPSWQIISPTLSPDEQWLARPPPTASPPTSRRSRPGTASGFQVRDFGSRPIFIARRMSRSPDGKSILAAVREGDTDIVLLDGQTRKLFDSRLDKIVTSCD